MSEESILLKNSIQLPFVRRKIGNILAVKQNLPLIRRFKAAYDTQSGSLTASAGTQQSQKLIFPDIKTHVVQDGGGTKRFCNMLQINQSVAHVYAPFLRCAVKIIRFPWEPCTLKTGRAAHPNERRSGFFTGRQIMCGIGRKVKGFAFFRPDGALSDMDGYAAA